MSLDYEGGIFVRDASLQVALWETHCSAGDSTAQEKGSPLLFQEFLDLHSASPAGIRSPHLE